MTTMLRFNAGKPRMTLLPASFYEALLDVVAVDYINQQMVREIVEVLEYGSAKYHEFNWADGGSWRMVADCALRHLLAEDEFDAESGLSHMAHFGCNLMFLLEFSAKPQFGDDDRYHFPVRDLEESDLILWDNPREMMLRLFARWTSGGDRRELLDALYYLNEWYHRNGE